MIDPQSDPTPSPALSPAPTPEAARVAIITGAAGGLGAVFAAALADDGWSVQCWGRTEATLAELVAGLPAVPEGHPAHGYAVCDIREESQVAAAMEETLARTGRLDLLVNNAGVPGPTGSIDTIDPEQWRATLETNTTGAFLCTQAAYRVLREQGTGGRIINNVSIAAHSPRAGAAAYAASKAALASLTTSVSIEGRPHRISACELDIGNAATALLATLTDDAPASSSAEPTFDAAHAAAMLRAIASLPVEVSADRVILTAQGMPYLGRG